MFQALAQPSPEGPPEGDCAQEQPRCLSPLRVEGAGPTPPDTRGQKATLVQGRRLQLAAKRVDNRAQARVGDANHGLAVLHRPQSREPEMLSGTLGLAQPGVAGQVDQKLCLRSRDEVANILAVKSLVAHERGHRMARNDNRSSMVTGDIAATAR